MLVVYHADCLDGFGAAYAAWTLYGDRARYVAARYGDPVPEMSPGEMVLLVDFSWPRDVIERVRGDGHLVTVIDHHQTAATALEGLEDCVFDQEYSGCVLTWRHLHHQEPVPQLLQHVEDRDLWRWALEGTREICLGLGIVPTEFAAWNALVQGGPLALLYLYEEGSAILVYQQKHELPVLISRSRVCVFEGFQCREVNSPLLTSEVGHELAEMSQREGGAPMSVVWSMTADGNVRVSLRSVGDFDVSGIARAHGGGGHRNAAGFSASERLSCTSIDKAVQ